MQTRVDAEPVAQTAVAAPGPSALSPAWIAADGDLDAPALPRDHPTWARDAVMLSMKARDLLARLKPLALRVFTFWDHTIRAIGIAGRRLSIDPAGGYRLD